MRDRICLTRIVVVGLLLAGGVAVWGDDQPEGARVMEFAIAVHGGAGGLPATEDARERREEAIAAALKAGRDVLADGGTSLQAVEAAVRVMEDSPWINAGRGAVCNAEGNHELDAAMMDGRTRACGAVGGVTTIRNPVSLARLVMTETPHILLATDGAERFADGFGVEQGIVRVSNDYFATEFRKQELERARAANRPMGMGTCGCVALDRHGNLAAATSTGGLTNKRFGRLGDTPIVGAGTYADNRTCAVSCTGTGEDFIRYSVAFDVSARMRYRGDTIEEATHAVLHDPDQLVRGGLIAIDRQGRIAMPFNTQGMSRGAADSTGRWEVRIGE